MRVAIVLVLCALFATRQAGAQRVAGPRLRVAPIVAPATPAFRTESTTAVQQAIEAEHRASVGRYALIGTSIGGAIGAAFVVSKRCSQFKDPLDASCNSVQSSIVVGGLLGAIPGALLGVLAAVATNQADGLR